MKSFIENGVQKCEVKLVLLPKATGKHSPQGYVTVGQSRKALQHVIQVVVE